MPYSCCGAFVFVSDPLPKEVRNELKRLLSLRDENELSQGELLSMAQEMLVYVTKDICVGSMCIAQRQLGSTH